MRAFSPRAFFLLLLAASAASLTAQTTSLKDFAGSWALHLGDRTLMVFTLSPSGGCITGTLEIASSFTGSNSLYSHISNTVRRDAITKCRFADGVLHITTQDATNPKDEDDYALTIHGNQAELSYDIPPGVPFVVEPTMLVRVPAGTTVSTDWEKNRAYTPTDFDAPSAEMKKIFDEDQRVRMADKIDWDAVNKSDAERREQTRKLLADGALHTGKDYEEAAFIFQHGSTPQDYLLAHTLAMVAISKGDSTAIWIAAATLDRYLQMIGQKQIYGTQYSTNQKQEQTQEPYDRTLISDALRGQLGVPSQATQEKQLKAYQAQQAQH